MCLYLAEETIAKFQGAVLPGDASVIPDSLQQGSVHNEYVKAFETVGDLEILFENHHVLLVNKPAGLLTQKAEKNDISLNEWLIGYLLHTGAITEEQLRTFKPSVCNRLDRNTSGIVICGKTLPGTQKMNALLKDRSMHKYYRLYVKGVLTEESYLEGYLCKDEAANRVTITDKQYDLKNVSGAFTKTYADKEKADYIATRYIPIAHCDEMTLLEVELITGKPHQIRAHLSSIGHPLLGDYKYGDRKWNSRFREQFSVEHQMLHAYRLEFPVMEDAFSDMSGLCVKADVPEVFTKLWESRQWQHGIQED